MTGIISAVEAMRHEGMRFEVYRLAVQNGFYNEGPGTIAHRGFQIIPMDGGYAVMQKGCHLISVKTVHIAKVWITCRLDNCGIVEANKKLRETK